MGIIYVIKPELRNHCSVQVCVPSSSPTARLDLPGQSVVASVVGFRPWLPESAVQLLPEATPFRT